MTSRTSVQAVKTVRRLVTDHEAPRLAIARSLKPLLGHVGYSVRVVALHHFAPRAVDIELSIKILALSLVRDEPIKARPRRIVLLSHVPFADVARLVTGGLQRGRKTLQVFWILSEVVDHAVRVSVQPAEDTRSTGRAERGCAEGVLEINASLPSRSMLGVFRCLLPPRPMASQRWSSVSMNNMFGRSAASAEQSSERQSASTASSA